LISLPGTPGQHNTNKELAIRFLVNVLHRRWLVKCDSPAKLQALANDITSVETC